MRRSFSLLAALTVLAGLAGPSAAAGGASQFVYTAESAPGVWVVELGRGVGRPRHISGSGGWHDPSLSPDGTRIAFGLRDERAQGAEDIFVATIDGEVIAQLTNTEFVENDPAWSPDGSRIAYVRGAGVWTMRSDGRNKVRVTDDINVDSVTWSPDGRQLAFARYTNVGRRIVVMRADGSDDASPQVVDVPNGTFASWSRDGERLAVAEVDYDPNGTRHAAVWVAPLNGNPPRKLVEVGGIRDIEWSPVDNRIAFVSRDMVWSVPASGGTASVLYAPDHEVRVFDWGRGLVCTVEGSTGDDVLRGTAEDDVVCSKAGADRVLATPGMDVVLGGAGRDTIDYRAEERHAVIDLRGGTARYGGGITTLFGVEAALGTPDDDVFFGDDARNVFSGYDGDDALIGRGGDDTLNGGSGNDVLRPGVGGDDVNGGDGRDTASFFDATARVRVNLANSFAFGQGEDIILGIERVIGFDFDDYIVGHDGRNVLKGGDGTDTIIGLDGPDDIFGGDERDYLYGRDGRDALYGNRGRDYANGGAAKDGCYSAVRLVQC